MDEREEKNMASELKSLSELFQKRVFRIPDYQRGYAWKQEQLVDFWEDLQNLSEDKYHYTGMLSLKKIAKNDKLVLEEDKWILNALGFNLFHIVDGQQRLTTFSILVFEIVKYVKMLSENSKKHLDEIVFGEMKLSDIIKTYIVETRQTALAEKVYLFGYEKYNPSSQFLKHSIFEEPHGGFIQESYYTRNLKQAKDFFAKNIGELYLAEGINGLETLFRKLTLQLKFNIHEIDDEYDVFIAFETMNNRGKRLTNLELLKNRLIYLSTLYRNEEMDEISKENLRKQINQSWQEVYFQVGRNAGKLLADDDLLRAHWILYFQYTRKRGDDYINFLLNKKFTAKNIHMHSAVQIDALSAEISDDSSPNYEIEEEEENNDVVESELSPQEISRYVNSLKDFSKHWFFSYFPQENEELSDDEKVWIGKLNRVGIADFRPLLATALSKNTSPEDRVNLFKAIERFIFLFFRVGRWRGNFKNSFYFIKARDLFYDKVNIREITDSLNNDVNSEMSAIIDWFIKETNDRFKNQGGGFYWWSDIKYFLYEYEDSLIPVSRPRKVEWDIFSKSEKSKVSIEHIFPQTPTNEYWQSRFGKFSPEEKNALASSLGNLLPLSLPINISLQNDSFPDKKKPRSGKSGYSTGSYSELEVAINDEWNPELIKKRGEEMLKWMAKRWNITIEDSQIRQLLHLDFLDSSAENQENK